MSLISTIIYYTYILFPIAITSYFYFIGSGAFVPESLPNETLIFAGIGASILMHVIVQHVKEEDK